MTPHPLPALRFKANRADDDIYDPLSLDVEDIVLRWAIADEDGGLVLDAVGAAMVMADLERLLGRTPIRRTPILLAVQRDAGRLGGR